MRNIPTEILGEILRAASDSSTVWEVIPLTHVCRRWRTLALGYPVIWARLALDDVPLELLDVVLARSAKIPVDLNVLTIDIDSVQRILALLKEHLARIRVLVLGFEVDFDDRTAAQMILDALCSPAPVIETFSVTIKRSDFDELSLLLPSDLFGHCAPMLTSLVFPGCVKMPRTCPAMRTVTEFRVMFPPTDAEDVLLTDLMPNIETVGIFGVESITRPYLRLASNHKLLRIQFEEDMQDEDSDAVDVVSHLGPLNFSTCKILAVISLDPLSIPKILDLPDPMQMLSIIDARYTPRMNAPDPETSPQLVRLIVDTHNQGTLTFYRDLSCAPPDTLREFTSSKCVDVINTLQCSHHLLGFAPPSLPGMHTLIIGFDDVPLQSFYEDFAQFMNIKRTPLLLHVIFTPACFSSQPFKNKTILDCRKLSKCFAARPSYVLFTPYPDVELEDNAGGYESLRRMVHIVAPRTRRFFPE